MSTPTDQLPSGSNKLTPEQREQLILWIVAQGIVGPSSANKLAELATTALGFLVTWQNVRTARVVARSRDSSDRDIKALLEAVCVLFRDAGRTPTAELARAIMRVAKNDPDFRRRIDEIQVNGAYEDDD